MDRIRSIIRPELESAYGQKILYAKDCMSLSLAIQEKTKRNISVSTLKRLFGIIESPYHPSKYTLDTLAVYLNYESWNELAKSQSPKTMLPADQDYWDRLKIRIRNITDQSLSSMKSKIGDPYADFPIRQFAVEKFEEFLNSHGTATALIAPEGYGKTTIVAQLTEMFFLGQKARYPDDIVCLIDGSILFNLVNLNQEIVRLLDVSNMEDRNNFSNYFRRHPDQVKGRFVLIIESLYQIFHREDKLNRFTENLMDIIASYDHIPWFKLLITCRPDNWKIFANMIQKDPNLKKLWFGVNISGPATDSINVPLLNTKEIREFLVKRHSAKSAEKLKYYHPDISELCNTPYMLYLFSANQNPQHICSDIELLDYFVSTKILVEPFLQEKSAIIQTYFDRLDYAKESTSLNKIDLPTSDEYSSAYKELIFHNVLYEYTIPGRYLSVNTYVKFSNDILLAYFLANKWMDEHDLDLELIRSVIRYYRHNRNLQCNIVKILIKIAFKEERQDILRDIFIVLETESSSTDLKDTDQLNREIISTIGIELRRNKKLRRILIPHYARSKSGQEFYFEGFFDMDSLVLHSGDDINSYLQYKQSEDAKIYGHFLKFMQYFLSTRETDCSKEYEIIRRLKLSDRMKPALAGYYYGAQMIYQGFFRKGTEPDLVKLVLEKSEWLYARKLQALSGVPDFEYIIAYSLNYGDDFNNILQLSEQAIKRYEITSEPHSWKHQIFLLIYARALLHAGDINKAIELHGETTMGAIPVINKYYVRLRYYLIRLEFLLLEQKKAEALGIIKEMKTIARFIKHHFFYERALVFEEKAKML